MSDKTVIHSQEINDYQLLDKFLKSWTKLEIIRAVLSRKINISERQAIV